MTFFNILRQNVDFWHENSNVSSFGGLLASLAIFRNFAKKKKDFIFFRFRDFFPLEILHMMCRLLTQNFSKIACFIKLLKHAIFGYIQKIACFINLLKDCVGQAIFAIILRRIAQPRNCVFYQLLNTQFCRIEKNSKNCVFYQFT